MSEAITIMLENDFSQIPVMIGERTVKGVVTWKSIARQVAFGKDYQLVRTVWTGRMKSLRIGISSMRLGLSLM